MRAIVGAVVSFSVRALSSLRHFLNRRLLRGLCQKLANVGGLCLGWTMPLAQAEKISPTSPAVSGVHFVAASRFTDLCGELRAQRYLLAAVGSSSRGLLRVAIDEAVEGVLAKRGALPPGVELDAALEPTLRDQIFRARALGAAGLAIALPTLSTIAGEGFLDAADSAAISAWLGAAKRAPLALVLDEVDRRVQVLAPVSLAELVAAAAVVLGADSGPLVTPVVSDPEPPAAPSPPAVEMPRRGVMKRRAARVEPANAAAHVAPEPSALRVDDPAPLLLGDATGPAPIECRDVGALRVDPLPEPSPPADPLQTMGAATPARVEGSVRRIASTAEWRAHAIELDKARGPKPVSAIERLYTSRYVPLLGAIARGEADSAIKGVADAWRMNFEHSYREAFSSLRVTGKRPSMVFDAPDIAGRIGRLNGARAVKLLLVDAMRFDLGERVAHRLHERLTGRALCVDRTLLWAAIPTTTPTQLSLLARGQEGLRESESVSDPETEIVRGRAVSTIRRERLGAREVMKLDLVEARIRMGGAAFDERLDAIADEIVPVLVKFIETLPPRTLLFLFGDHGFRLPSSADGLSTGPAVQGGLSPEEVLVPGQAWLVGGVH